MPIVQFFTNLSRISFQPEFSKELAKVIATSLDRPVDHVSLCVIPDCLMMFGGSDAGHAHIKVTSMTSLGEKLNGKHCAAINGFISEKLPIALDRILIQFFDVKGFEVGLGDKIASELK